LSSHAHQSNHILSKPADSGRATRSPLLAAPNRSPSEKLLEIVDTFAQKFSEQDIWRDHERVKNWAQKAPPGSYHNFPGMKLHKDQQGYLQLEFGGYVVDVDHFFKTLLSRQREVTAKSNRALPVATNPPTQALPDNTQQTNAPVSALPPPSRSSVAANPLTRPLPGNIQQSNPPAIAIPTIPTPSGSILPSHPTSTATAPAPAIPPRPSQLLPVQFLCHPQVRLIKNILLTIYYLLSESGSSLLAHQT